MEAYHDRYLRFWVPLFGHHGSISRPVSAILGASFWAPWKHITTGICDSGCLFLGTMEAYHDRYLLFWVPLFGHHGSISRPVSAILGASFWAPWKHITTGICYSGCLFLGTMEAYHDR